mmetsp:Transcript_60967/g.169039  ORF Transcript_60967/g.169039 Transcript_60967/m.169039 type:complete len:102 (-) Transcript_60967:65-370(-)
MAVTGGVYEATAAAPYTGPGGATYEDAAGASVGAAASTAWREEVAGNVGDAGAGGSAATVTKGCMDGSGDASALTGAAAPAGAITTDMAATGPPARGPDAG